MPRKQTLETRPDIASITTGHDLKRWYWRKDELVAQARAIGVKTTDGKFQILDRIAHFLDTGETVFPGDVRAVPRSKFDWHAAALTHDTVITDSYKNSQNVRRFFKMAIGPEFKFNTAFMDWMRSNVGKTLGDACAAYHAIQASDYAPGHRRTIRDHNQFNQYTRDFLDDNPTLSMADVRRVWALKIQRPSDTGRHVYEPGDLELDEPKKNPA
ncbi:MAG: DUF6434 domain-containing protein [Pseudomonadota bacterium]